MYYGIIEGFFYKTVNFLGQFCQRMIFSGFSCDD